MAILDESRYLAPGLPVTGNMPIPRTPVNITMSPANLLRYEEQRALMSPSFNYTPTWYTQNGPVQTGMPATSTTIEPDMADTTNGWPKLRPGATQAEVDNYIRTYYGYMSAFMAIPEVGNILRTAAKEGYDQFRLFGAISATNWWKTTSANERQWLSTTSQDPAEANRLRGQRTASIRDLAGRLGVGLSGPALQKLTEDTLRYGWDETQILDAVMSQSQYRQGQMQGMISANMDNAKQMAATWGLLLDDKTAYDWSVRVLNQSLTPEGIETSFRRQAKARYSYMADLIDQGVTVQDYFAPVRSTIANELEVAPDTINLLDQRYLTMMEVRDPKTGELRAATTSEAQKTARKDPRWRDTRAAGELAAGMVSLLDKAMGVR
jgi:hypothetical protein